MGLRVVIAGAGIAGLETLVGLRELAGRRVELTLLAPVDSFVYRPLSTAEPFTFRKQRSLALARVAEDMGARFVRDDLAYVDQTRARVLTRDGDFVAYDVLVLATGARQLPAHAQATMWPRGEQRSTLLSTLLRELQEGAAREVAFVVPSGAAWPVDAYELSLSAARAARHAELDARILLITAEQAPLEVFGPAASTAVGEELKKAGVELRTGLEVQDPPTSQEAGRDAFSSAIGRLSGRDGREPARTRTELSLSSGERLPVDRVVSLPLTHGPAIAGVAGDEHGFVAVDAHARAAGGSRVFVVGDASSLRLKHSLLAAAQANAAAQAIAAEAGADLTPEPCAPILYGILAVPAHFPGPTRSVWLADGEPMSHCLWWPPGHVTGRYLAPYIAARDPAVHTGLLWHPPGIHVATNVADESPSQWASLGESPSEEAVESDAHARQLLALRRSERKAQQLEHALDRGHDEFEQHERTVIERLEAAGYLLHAPGKKEGDER